MELIRESSIAAEARYITDWPKVPQLSIAAAVTQIADKETEIQHKQDHQDRFQISNAEQTNTRSKSTEKDHVQENRCPRIEDQRPTAEAAEPLKTQAPERRWLGLRRFSLQKSQWPSPHLSIGIKCNRMGSNECWEAIGPAQELFAEISQSIGDLLDTRVEEIEEGEPVAGNILTFGMYMIGRSIGTARPTLIFTCQRTKPRRRAIKFIKESEILKYHPKVALAESAVVPMAHGRNYLRLLASLHKLSSDRGSLSATWIHRRDVNTSKASHALKTPQILGIVIGLVVAFLGVVIVIIVIIRRLNKVVKATTMSQSRKKITSWTLAARPRDRHIDTKSLDPLIITPAETTLHSKNLLSPFSAPSSSLTRHPNGYNPVPGSETNSSHSTSEPQNTAVYSNPALSRNPNSGSLDILEDLARDDVESQGQNLRFGHTRFSLPSYRHTLLDRLQSVESDASYTTDISTYSGLSTMTSVSSTPGDVELGHLRNKRSTLQRTLQGFGMSSMITWLRKDRGTSTQMSSIALSEHEARPIIVNESPQVQEILKSNEPLDQVFRNENIVDPHLHECTLPYGMSIMSVETGKMATIGGIIFSKDKYYGLTVAHAFADACITETTWAPSEPENNDPEFAFDEGDEEEIGETNLSDVAVTSQASMSLASLSRSNSVASTNSGYETSIAPRNADQITTYSKEAQNNAIVFEIDETRCPRYELISSVSKTDLARDWALVELTEASVLRARAAISKDVLFQDIILPTRFQSIPVNDTEVMVIKGYSGISKGRLSSSSTMMKLQPRGTFQEVWTVRLAGEGTLVEGDSGSWVIDAITGDLYGHVVAGVPETGLAYIVPAYKTFADIEKCLGPVELTYATV